MVLRRVTTKAIEGQEDIALPVPTSIGICIGSLSLRAFFIGSKSKECQLIYGNSSGASAVSLAPPLQDSTEET